MSANPETRESPAIGQRAQPWLGTLVSIRVAAEPDLATRAMGAAFDEIGEIHRQMSFHDPASELSRLNTRAHREPQAVSARLRRVLSVSLALAHATGGSFDPTIGRRLVEQGRLPAPAGDASDPDARWHDVALERDGRVRFRRPLWLDLGGIAKGYAVDRAIACLRRQGVASAVVNAGGDLRSFGPPHVVWVRDPADPGRNLPLLEIGNAAVATSAGYFNDHPPHSAIVDPRTGAGLGDDCSVTVCARRAIWADGLTKAVLADPTGSVALLRRLGASAVLLDRNGGRRHLS
ncbi:MAG TPA: FAD:protein FMN transferase [Thermoanaerobaculia bacterium]|nr:FAD:protein FMN transferase [Thermoanaerobaculia bacterium]